MAFSHWAIVFLVELSLLGLGTNSQVPDPVALYPLDGDHGTKEINNRFGAGVASGVYNAPGPDGKPNGSYKFSGTVNSYIEFPNGGGLDVKNSITMLCWLYPGGQDGPLFNYRGHKTGSWGVHLWVVSGQLFVRFNKRDYSSTQHLLHTPLKPKDGWKFVGASYDQANGHAKLWVDGKVVQTLNIGANLQLATQDSVRMGVRVSDNRYFKGRIAQMQVYNVALTQEQVKLIKDRTQVGNVTDPGTKRRRRRREAVDDVTNLQPLAEDSLHLAQGKPEEEKSGKDLDTSARDKSAVPDSGDQE